jgi:hypothetical protein
MMWFGKLIMFCVSIVLSLIAIVGMCIALVIHLVVISISCRDDEEQMRLEWENFFCIFMPWIFFPNTRWRVRTMQRHLKLVKEINKYRSKHNDACLVHDDTLKQLRRNRPELFMDNGCPEQC